MQNVPLAMRLSFLITLINEGRGLAEDIFGTLEHTLPVGCSIGITNHAYQRAWPTVVRDGRTCTTITLGKETILPPGAELMVMALTLDVSGKGKGDLSFTLSVGSRHGPGAAQTVFFPAQVIDDAYAHYTRSYISNVEKQAAEKGGVLEPLKACLKVPGRSGR